MLELVALVLVIVVCIAMLGVTARSFLLPPAVARAAPTARSAPSRTPALPTDPISIDGVAIKGNPRAPVAILGYSDYQCPFCVRFATGTFPDLDKAYLATGKASFAFKHLPIASIHPQAVTAAEASECAGRQGQFWQMHDRLFANPKQFGASAMHEHAKTLSLDQASFVTCLNGQASGRVEIDVKEAARLGITATPTFFIGIVQPDGRIKVVDRILGAQPMSVFAASIDAALGRADSDQKK